jgi:hypothetical protein
VTNTAPLASSPNGGIQVEAGLNGNVNSFLVAGEASHSALIWREGQSMLRPCS